MAGMEMGVAEGTLPHRIRHRPSVIRKYGELVAADEMLRLANARVLVVDYPALYADFPQLHPDSLVRQIPRLQSLSEHARLRAMSGIADRWLLNAAGLISRGQLHVTDVNTEIKIKGRPFEVFRPPRYGRACITKVRSQSLEIEELSDVASISGGGELDIKGVGVQTGRVPSRHDYALQEYIVQRVLDAILANANAGVSALPIYGIIDTGFDGFTCTDRRFPAGLVVRRAHLRTAHSDLPGWGTLDQHMIFRIELLLRKYGITSSKRNRLRILRVRNQLAAFEWGERKKIPHKFLSKLVERFAIEVPFEADRVNIQMDASEVGGSFGRQILDFGQYEARPHFDRPVLSLVHDRPLCWGGFIDTNHECFVQPDRNLVPNETYWQKSCEPSAELFGDLATEIVSYFRDGKVDHARVHSVVSDVLKNVTEQWGGVSHA
jgi:hypothetical protein